MLVLTRKVGESIVIGKDTTITVTSIERGKIRLGIVAPREVPIHRKEVQDAIHGEGKEDGIGPAA